MLSRCGIWLPLAPFHIHTQRGTNDVEEKINKSLDGTREIINWKAKDILSALFLFISSSNVQIGGFTSAFSFVSISFSESINMDFIGSTKTTDWMHYGIIPNALKVLPNKNMLNC